jgi:hypothetical protein
MEEIEMTQIISRFLNRTVLAAALPLLALVAGQQKLQAKETPTLAKVPFSFQVKSRKFPAGDYRLKPVSFGQKVYLLTNMQTRKSVMVGLPAGYGDQPTALLFAPNGDGKRLVGLK